MGAVPLNQHNHLKNIDQMFERKPRGIHQSFASLFDIHSQAFPYATFPPPS